MKIIQVKAGHHTTEEASERYNSNVTKLSIKVASWLTIRFVVMGMSASS